MQQPQTMPVHPAFANRKVLILAIILGVIAAGLVVAYLSSRGGSGANSAPIATVQAVVATQDIPSGTKITGKMVGVKAVPQDAVIASPLTETKAAVGQVARYPVAKGAQLSSTTIGAELKSTALSYEIPDGKRAMTIPVGNDMSPAALMVPGDFVDVLSVGDLDKAIAGGPGTTPVASADSQNQPPKVAVTLVQNVQVLAVQNTYVDNGVPYDPDTRGSQATDKTITNVTLALDPAQAQLVFLASQRGTNGQNADLTVVLRHVGDKDTPALPPVSEPIIIPPVVHQ
jgi:pilus assembly protein CpaB